MKTIFKREDLISWGVLGAIILILYFVFSDGQFSLIFTLAGTVQTFGFALIAIKIRKSRSVTGLSRETFICYTIIFGVRFILFMFFKVSRSLFRATYPTIPPATSSSRSKKGLLCCSAGISCIASALPSRPATTRISILSNRTISLRLPQFSRWSSTRHSTGPSWETTCGPSRSTWRPSPSSASSCSSATR